MAGKVCKGKVCRKRVGRKWLLVASAAAVVFAVAVAAVGKGKDSGMGEEGLQPENTDLEFPYALENGKLLIDSLFQFSGNNPDCGEEEGEDIAALSLVNGSGQHLTQAQITMELSSGIALEFEVRDLPAGQPALVFEKNNVGYALSDRCHSIGSDAQFEEKTALLEGQLLIEVQGTAITLTNISGEALTEVLLHCHCRMDDAYFGGLTYIYPIGNISANERVTIQAEECYLGEAEVVRVSRGNGGE